MRITIDGTVVRGELWGNPTANSLIAKLPLTLDFRDFNALEKVATVTPPLSMDGMPSGDDPEPQDIGWYAPSGELVLYYGDVGYWNGIARIGRLDSVLEIADRTVNFQAVIEIDSENTSSRARGVPSQATS